MNALYKEPHGVHCAPFSEGLQASRPGHIQTIYRNLTGSDLPELIAILSTRQSFQVPMAPLSRRETIRVET